MLGLQAVIWPASESKMNAAGALAWPAWTTKPLVGLKTTPVGAPPGILTTSGAMTGMLPRTAPE
jgi:hypothetical protein